MNEICIKKNDCICLSTQRHRESYCPTQMTAWGNGQEVSRIVVMNRSIRWMRCVKGGLGTCHVTVIGDKRLATDCILVIQEVIAGRELGKD